jgi:cell cycle sensor histidine kinase DivJ
MGGLVAILLYPIYLYRTGIPGFLDILVLVWFLSPVVTVYYLCRTGNLAIAHMISAINLTIFVTVGAVLTGGIHSFLIAWMVIVPLEAALSGHKKVIFIASSVAVVALLGLYIGSSAGLFIATRQFGFSQEALFLFGLFSACTYGSAIAMTVQKAHEESENSIRESEQKYRLMANNSTDMISVHDHKGMVTFASPIAEQLFNTEAEHLLQGGLLERIHISDRPIYMTALSNCRSSEQAISAEFRVRRATNSNSQAPDYIWLEMRCKRVGPANDEDHHIIAVTRDISVSKTQELALLKARDEAETANIAKTRFLANMSHELRTPLNAIIGFSDVLNMELYGKLGNDKYADYSRLINDAGEHLLSIVNNILDMSKIEVGKFSITPEAFELNSLVDTCCDMMEPEANDASVQIIKEFDIDELDIVADSRAVKQMMINLLSNAIKFSPVDKKIIVRVATQGQSTTLEVIDQGIGISHNDLPKLCNPFVQADNSYKRQHEGVGLGLSVVKGLANLHGGNLTIDSTLGIGTTARIELPLEASINENSPTEIVQKIDEYEACIIPFNETTQTLKKAGQANN